MSEPNDNIVYSMELFNTEELMQSDEIVSDKNTNEILPNSEDYETQINDELIKDSADYETQINEETENLETGNEQHDEEIELDCMETEENENLDDMENGK